MADVMEKPFTMDLDYAKLLEEGMVENKNLDKMVKPFTMDVSKSGADKLYLLLLIYQGEADNEEPRRDFQFITGRQKVYDHLKTLLEDKDESIDAMRSLVLVDSDKVKISFKYPVYRFMKESRESLLITDDSSFDIDDYYYDEENTESYGEEQQ